MHLDDGQIERLLHAELSTADAARVRGHLADCADCRARVAHAQKEEAGLFALLGSLDAPSPAMSVRTIIERARRTRHVPLRWAATIVVTLGVAGAAVALPGSPLRGWLNRLVKLDTDSTEQPTTTVRRPDRMGGIAVAPGERLVIEFNVAQARGSARVQLVADGDVVVRSLNGSATFTSGTDRLLIDNRGSVGSFEIQIPRSAPHVEIILAGRRILLKEGARVTSDARADSGGVYSLRLSALE